MIRVFHPCLPAAQFANSFLLCLAASLSLSYSLFLLVCVVVLSIAMCTTSSKGGRRHVLMLPVNALVKGLNQVSMNDPLLEGWMGVSPAELAR